MRVPVAVLSLLCAVSVADAAVRVPLPRPRPPQLGQSVPLPPVPKVTAAPTAAKEGQAKTEAAGKPEPPKPSACQLALKAIAVFKPLPPINGAGECGIADAVSLEAATLADGTTAVVNPPATLRCEMAQAVAHWLRDDVAPTAVQLGAPLRGIENYDSYDCRGRNRVFGAKISEHGRGNALDVRAVKLASGAFAHLTDPHVAKVVRDGLRRSACERFKTVLGPGSDGYHESHIHVDLAQRRSNYRLCQWDVRIPLDRSSPSPHVVMSRSPTPHVTMISAAKESAPAVLPKPRPARRRSAAQR